MRKIRYTSDELKALNLSNFNDKPFFFIDPKQLEIARFQDERTRRSRKSSKPECLKLVLYATKLFYDEEIYKPSVSVVGTPKSKIKELDNSEHKKKEIYMKKLQVVSKNNSLIRNFTCLYKFLDGEVRELLMKPFDESDNKPDTSKMIICDKITNILKSVHDNEVKDFKTLIDVLRTLYQSNDKIDKNTNLVNYESKCYAPRAKDLFKKWNYMKEPEITPSQLNDKTQMSYDIEKMRCYLRKISHYIFNGIGFNVRLELQALNRILGLPKNEWPIIDDPENFITEQSTKSGQITPKNETDDNDNEIYIPPINLESPMTSQTSDENSSISLSSGYNSFRVLEIENSTCISHSRSTSEEIEATINKKNLTYCDMATQTLLSYKQNTNPHNQHCCGVNNQKITDLKIDNANLKIDNINLNNMVLSLWHEKNYLLNQVANNQRK